jgi:hypothetical protein
VHVKGTIDAARPKIYKSLLDNEFTISSASTEASRCPRAATDGREWSGQWTRRSLLIAKTRSTVIDRVELLLLNERRLDHSHGSTMTVAFMKG